MFGSVGIVSRSLGLTSGLAGLQAATLTSEAAVEGRALDPQHTLIPGRLPPYAEAALVEAGP